MGKSYKRWKRRQTANTADTADTTTASKAAAGAATITDTITKGIADTIASVTGKKKTKKS